MNITGNTILITGGGSGIGRALAEAFHARGNQVVIAGRRQDVLDATTAAHPGMKSAVLDIEDPAAIRRFAEQLRKDFPSLNVVIHNAGIMRPERLTDGTTDTAEATITTNLLGPIRLNAALIDHLLAQPKASIVTVSSGLAFLPFRRRSDLLRDQGGDPFVFGNAALPAEGHVGTGAGTGTALCADRIDG